VSCVVGSDGGVVMCRAGFVARECACFVAACRMFASLMALFCRVFVGAFHVVWHPFVLTRYDLA